MSNKKSKHVISWHKVEGSTTLQRKYFIDDKEVTDYEYYGLGEYVDADVPTLEALLEKTREEEPGCSLKFTQEWQPKMALIKKLIRIEKLGGTRVLKEKQGSYIGMDENGFPNIFM